jgi:hypothetical protein
LYREASDKGESRLRGECIKIWHGVDARGGLGAVVHGWTPPLPHLGRAADDDTLEGRRAAQGLADARGALGAAGARLKGAWEGGAGTGRAA